MNEILFFKKGTLLKWELLLHGTQQAPYIDEIVRNKKSKLAISKKLEYAEGVLHEIEEEKNSLYT